MVTCQCPMWCHERVWCYQYHNFSVCHVVQTYAQIYKNNVDEGGINYLLVDHLIAVF